MYSNEGSTESLSAKCSAPIFRICYIISTIVNADADENNFNQIIWIQIVFTLMEVEKFLKSSKLVQETTATAQTYKLTA